MYSSSWPVFACAAFAFIYYAYELPVVFAIAARVGSYGVGLGAVSAKGAIRRARTRAALDMPKPKKKKLFMPDSKALFRLAYHIFRRGNLLYIEITGTLGLHDAMYTALSCAALQSLGAAFRDVVYVRVTPDFSSRASNLEISGIAEIKLGHIIRAALKTAMTTFKKRGQKDG